MIFQAMGAKYTFSSATRYLFAGGNESDSDKLRQALKNHYSGEVTLYHKGRAALAEAIRLATGGEGGVAISGLTCYSVVQAVKAAGCTPRKNSTPPSSSAARPASRRCARCAAAGG